MSRPRWKVPPPWTHVTVIETVLECDSPLSIKGNESDTTGDAPVLTGDDGMPFIPGTSLAGVLRSELHRWIGSASAATAHRYLEAENTLFGGEPGDDEGLPSSLIIDDLFLLGDLARIERRDHVRLEQGPGVAQDHAKYDRDTVAVGTRFGLRMEWRSVGDPRQRRPLEEKQVLLLALRLLEGENERASLRLGGRTRRGFGGVRAITQNGRKWGVRIYDLTRGAELVEWLQIGDRPADTGHESVQGLAAWLEVETLPEPAREFLELDLTLSPAGSLLVRGPGRSLLRDKEHESADSSQLRRSRADGETESVVPATGFAGALRHRGMAIAQVLGIPNSEQLVDRIFGRPPDCQDPAPGMIQFDEAVVTGANEMRQTRVCIDPWTGGALDHFLFTEDILHGGTLSIRVIVRNGNGKDHEPALGLLFLALRDLWEGDLPVGGEVSVGRGALRAKQGVLRHAEKEERLTFDGEGRLVGGGECISAWVESLQQCRQEVGE